MFGVEVTAVHGELSLEAIDVRDSTSAATTRLESGGLFIFIGADAQTGWLPSEIALDHHGYVLTGSDMRETGRWTLDRDPYLLETSVPGIFACGDVRFGPVKRVAAAVGEGSMAIAFVHQYLRDAGASEADSRTGRSGCRLAGESPLRESEDGSARHVADDAPVAAGRSSVGAGVTPFQTDGDATIRLAVAAEELGYARFGAAEGWTQDAVVILTQIAGVTSRIALATTVLPVWSRSPRRSRWPPPVSSTRPAAASPSASAPAARPRGGPARTHLAAARRAAA